MIWHFPLWSINLVALSSFGHTVANIKEPTGKEKHSIFVRVFISVNRHHDQGIPYKGRHFIAAGLQLQKFSPLTLWQKAWQHVGRHGAGGAESSIPWSFRKRETVFCHQLERRSLVHGIELEPRTSKPTYQRPSSSPKSTPIPTRLYLTVPLPMGWAVSNHHTC